MIYELFLWVYRKFKVYCLISYLLLWLCLLGYLGLIWYWIRRLKKQKEDDNWRQTYLNKILSLTTKKSDISNKAKKVKFTSKSIRRQEETIPKPEITNEQPTTTKLPSISTPTISDVDYSFQSEQPKTTGLPSTSTPTISEAPFQSKQPKTWGFARIRARTPTISDADYSFQSKQPETRGLPSITTPTTSKSDDSIPNKIRTPKIRERRRILPYSTNPPAEEPKPSPRRKRRDFRPDALDQRGVAPKKYRKERTWYDDDDKEEKPTVAAMNLAESTTNPKVSKVSVHLISPVGK